LTLGTPNARAVHEHQPGAWLGRSEMAEEIRGFDWTATPLGPIADWPRSLRSAVATCVHSRFQMAIYWGPELICVYNDAERDVLGALHPAALGMPARDLLHESWEVVGPQLEAVMAYGESTWAEDQALSFDRRGIVETGYFTYSYSPVLDDDDRVGGVLLVTQETTARVLAEWRLDVLRELAVRSMDAPTAREACELATRAMHGRPELAFVLIYLIDPDGGRAVCTATSGRAGDPRAPHASVDLSGSSSIAALFKDLAAVPRQSRLVNGELIVAAERQAATIAEWAVAAPITRGSADPVDGFLVAGISDGFPPDASCRHFIEMVGIGLGRSIAAARAREEDRDRARSLAALEQARTALFSNASHELRTPLALVLGPLEQVMDDTTAPEAVREQVAVARRSASRMLKIVNGLLDFSRLESGGWIGTFAPTDLAQLTRDVGAMFRATAERSGLRLSVDCPMLPRPVSLDPEAWECVVSNLLSNALKFTPSGSIEVQVRPEREHAVLTVTDTGIGITAEDIGRIFARFYRVEDPLARSQEGTGLGLALVRELVRMHGGTVTAQSTPGQGTNMVIRVPYDRDHGRANGRVTGRVAPHVGATASTFVEEARGWDERGKRNPIVGSANTTRENADVLVVEDNEDMRDYLCRLLAPRFAVRVAGNGAEAYRNAITDPPGVVISDVMMPGSDGFRLLHDLRADRRTKHIPVILVSARADPESTIEALRLGADDYLVKPFGARELLARVSATLQSSRVLSADAEARGRAEERALAQDELRSLLNELKAAQRRIVAAGDAERRRVERNLHDGAQQRLMAIRLELGLVRERLEIDPSAAHAELDGLRGELDEALEELRELAHGLYPPLLASDGLPAALSAAGRHAAIQVEVEAPDIPRLPQAIENAVYFCCMEALQNAVKHAGEDARAVIFLVAGEGALAFRVSDDGVGFDPGRVPQGYGLSNLTDRVAALGGEARIDSAPGKGTTLSGHIPLA
jgi:signal transduction histidine kinase